MSIKKITALFLILIFVGTFPVFSGSVSTYDILKEENDPFVERLAETGLPYVKINEFLTDFDEQISTLKVPEKREYIEKYFLSFLFNILLENEDHAELCVAFDSVFQEEFNYMLENDMAIPKTFERFFLVSMGSLILEETVPSDSEVYYPEPELDIPEENGETETNEKNEEAEAVSCFPDLENHKWAEKSISFVYENGIMNGYEDGSFKPGGFLTRAEGTKIVCKAFLKSGYVVLESEYEDIKKTDWFYKNVVNAEYFTLFSKMYSGEFLPNTKMTRQEFCTLAYRGYLRKNGFMDTKKIGIDFFDSSEISSYAYEAVTKLQKAGILNGDGSGNFNPKENITRAEAAKIIELLINYE